MKFIYVLFFLTFLSGILFLPSVSAQLVPEWVKNNAGWWSEGLIDDTAFLQGIQFLIKEGIMIITPTPQLNHFKHTLKKKRHNQPHMDTPDFDTEVQKVQNRVNKVREGSEKRPLLPESRLSWEDEQVLHQYDDIVSQENTEPLESKVFQDEYKKNNSKNREIMIYMPLEDHVDEEH